jgi:hypothetical protein
LDYIGPGEIIVYEAKFLTDAGFLYLSLLMDKRFRKIVGYHAGDTRELPVSESCHLTGKAVYARICNSAAGPGESAG